MPRSPSALLLQRSARLSLLFLLAFSCALFAADGKARKRPRSQKPEESATPSEGIGLKNIPLTIGHEARGLVLPNYDLQGRLLGRFEAEVASRIDEQHVRFQGLKMTTFDEHEKPDLRVNMTRAVLDLDTRVITSDARTTIKRTDFEIAGDTMHFNTSSHEGTLTGRVHMTIYNQSQLGGPPAKKP